jgi:hypothetical protein
LVIDEAYDANVSFVSLQPRSAVIPAATQQPLDLVVVAQERHEQLFRPALKDETEREARATLEEVPTELPDPQPAVTVRLTEALDEIREREKTIGSLLPRQIP